MGARKRFAPGEFVEFRLPVHSDAPFATPPFLPPQARDDRVGVTDKFPLQAKLP